MTDLHTELADARNVLLCAPSMSGGEAEACTDLLIPSNPAGATALWVTFRSDATDCVDQWVAETDERPAEAAVVVVGESPGSRPDGVTVEHVSSPSDLTGLGITIGELLSGWETPPVVCFDSLTALLQYVDVETAYEFLHAVTGQLYAADARAHFHIDPTAHDRTTVDSIASLFDAVVEFGDDGPETRKRHLLQ
ncbi:hypothetical protein HZS55_02845 [Halosimplex rubrum]|uniref:Uncharacterized protein n=1 Tax=Halosimplex rubrum TaxID=869889 RepID=A0A7D5NYA1_9EURY|nr:hypothetical protein [Halosimplex rubrum]QLH76303.1 hypothetical protein HZS55_02845 [Halosimplex rubrum]